MKQSDKYRLDERNHVEKPLLDQLFGLGWEMIDLTDEKQTPAHTFRETFTQVVMPKVLREQIKIINELLRADTSDLVMAMIHKFREADLTETFPLLNDSPHILIMTDEAHRSQYKMLEANLDKGIPNAAKISYTGTPIDKTERVFGDYIDKYTMRQAIDDGVTLEIVYEGRTHHAEVPDQAGMDQAFADIFSDYRLQERLDILGYGSRDAYLEAESTIKAKAGDMVNHYLTHVFPNGYKAQVVATSREAAVQATLLQPTYTKLPNLRENRARIISRVMEIAEKNNDVILYAV